MRATTCAAALRTAEVGAPVGVGVPVAVGAGADAVVVGPGVDVAVGVAVGVDVGVAVGLGVATGVAVGVGVTGRWCRWPRERCRAWSRCVPCWADKLVRPTDEVVASAAATGSTNVTVNALAAIPAIAAERDAPEERKTTADRDKRT